MITVAILGVTDADRIRDELEKSANFNLRVISNDILSTEQKPDICVFSAEKKDEISDINAKKIIVFKPDCIDSALMEQFNIDDFICDPVNTDELRARIELLYNSEQASFEHRELYIDFKACRVCINGNLVHLTLLEYKLLCILVKNRGKIVSYSEILKELWGTPIGNEMLSIRVFVTAIRKKFASAGAMEEYIKTHMGKGYELI